MLLFPSLKKKKKDPPAPPAQRPALCCPECGENLIKSGSAQRCVFCGKSWTPDALTLDYSRLAKSAYQDKVASKYYEKRAEKAEKEAASAWNELQKERALRAEIEDELNRLRMESLDRDPLYLASSVDDLNRRLSSMERLLHDMIEG